MRTETTTTTTRCCAPFDPASWDGKELVWHDKRFVKERVHSLLYVPIDRGSSIAKSMERIEAARALDTTTLMLSDERSPWTSDLYIPVDGPVPDVELVTISGTFFTRVFEGPIREVPAWINHMKSWGATRGRSIEKIYFAYPTCPRCAKAYGKNHVVLFAKVSSPAHDA